MRSDSFANLFCLRFLQPESGRGAYSGRQIRYGIREFATAAVANGMAAYFPVSSGRDGGGILPIYSTFFTFTSYAMNAIRMAALQKLRTVSFYPRFVRDVVYDS